MSKIVFIKPALEADATWDPIRTCSYLGLWFMASLLKHLGHQVWYLDEIVRDGGLQKKFLFKRTLRGRKIKEVPLSISYEDFQAKKIADYQKMGAEKFCKFYSAFKKNGVVERVIVRVGNLENETLTKIVEINPDFVGIPLIATANYLPATRLARLIKEKLPNTKIIFGGQHIGADPEGFLRNNPYIDQVVVGDAIAVIEKIVTGKLTDKIVFGDFQEMSEYPLLDPNIIEDTGYPIPPIYTFPTEGRRYVDFMFSRGCFRHCEFCVAGCQNTHVSATGYDKLDEQLRLFKEAGIKELVIQDDAFLWDEKHVKAHLPKILALMKKHGMYWQNNGGIDFEGLTDFVTDQFVQYNERGEGRITALYIPFNPRGWNRGKSSSGSMTEKYHQNMKNLKRLRRAGIYIFTSAIIGSPEQNPETFKEELAVIRSLVVDKYIDSALPLSATMLPATIWYKTNGINIVNKKDYAGFSLFTTHHRTKYFEPQDIERMMIEWLKKLEDVQKVYPWGTAFST